MKKPKAKVKVREKSEKKEEIIKIDNVLWVGIVIIIIALVIAGLIYTYSKSKSFEYAGLNFVKTRMGEVVFYHAKILLFNSDGVAVNYYNLYLRNDPRTLEDIEIYGKIRMMKKVILASDGLECEDGGLAGGVLGDMLGILGVKVHPATTNKTAAEEQDIRYVSCNLTEGVYVDATGLIFKPGNVTEIRQIRQDCYEVTVKECDILRASERFTLGIYAHSKGIEI